MGEVYRADDLKLEQAVALKFLPVSVLGDAAALARFHREVRVARQVSHPNVCRVFDIGETDGNVFLSMEYVDGEDLSSLLRRIGRLPQDKAIEIARQMCAGLAAAHEFGVLHRDFKPANVMIDGRGKARITDFGLAGIATEFAPEELRAGTPAYMAPEQLAGQELTVRTDIYALGLVLYELFTGKRAFDAPTVVKMKDLGESSSPTSPTSIVKDLDPAVERAIQRCLEKDPKRRPASALQVAASLPGGDPLAAALAAGETPSPEMVAASGETEGVRPAVAWASLAAVLVLTIGCVILAGKTKLYRMVPIEKPPEVLAERAQEILRTAGYTETPGDSAMSFEDHVDFLRYVKNNDKTPERWKKLEYGAFSFWYRSSPRPLEAIQFFSQGPSGPGTILPDDPPLQQSGMTLVELTPRGHLTRLTVVPPQVEKEGEGATKDVNWAALFEAAGLHQAEWTAVPPKWLPPTFADTRAAWTGKHPERPEISMRIEAAAFRGRPVYFDLIGPWTRPEQAQPSPQSTGQEIAKIIGFCLLVTIVTAGLVRARQNLRSGRGDRKGATRLVVLILVTNTFGWVLEGHHVPNFYELGLFVLNLSGALLFGSLMSVLYIALEPFVRRHWPATLVSWTRLVTGDFRDPLVGRDLQAGLLIGSFSIVVTRTLLWAPSWFGNTLQQPYAGPTREFLGPRIMLASSLGSFQQAIVNTLTLVFVLFLLKRLLRKEWLAGGALIVILSMINALQSETPVISGLAQLVSTGASVVLVIRFGLLALLASSFFGFILTNAPLTTDMSVWYAGTSSAALLLIVAIAFYSFYISLGGRPMFGAATQEE